MKTIRSWFGMPAVTAYVPKHGEDTSMVLPDQLIGVELEIEDFPTTIRHAFDGMGFTTDGSLRNNGMEIITAPTACKYIPASLTAFFKRFEITDRNYSERCSTHVHFNMQERSPEQVAVICLLYQSVERLLFRFIGNDRDHSIFCVPWQQSNLTYQLVENLCSKDILSPLRRWQKYSALNLMPLLDKGTIEFRHMHGTHDVNLICSWINLCSRLIKFADTHTLEETKQQIINMNTVSNYRQWIDTLFGGQSALLFAMPDYELDLERGIIECKYMLMGKDDSTEAKFTFRPDAMRFINPYDPPPAEVPNDWAADMFRAAIPIPAQADDPVAAVQRHAERNQLFNQLLDEMATRNIEPPRNIAPRAAQPRQQPPAPHNPLARRRNT
jgi:hypothetical protein